MIYLLLNYLIEIKKWYHNGIIHRDNDLPAVEKANGDKFWYKKDKLINEKQQVKHPYQMKFNDETRNNVGASHCQEV